MNHRRRVWAVARKEFLHVLRDPRSLAMAIAMPMLLLMLFGYALTLDVDNVPLVVWDQSQTPASRDFVSRFGGSRYFSLKRYGDNYRELEHAIDSGEALVALVVPSDFAGRSRPAAPRRVQMIVDGSDSNTATSPWATPTAVTQAYSPGRGRLTRISRSAAGAAGRRSISARASGSTRTCRAKLHHPRADRRDHDGDRGAADLADRGARVGARHDGAADLHAGQGPGADPRQAAALLRHRHAGRAAGGADGRVPVSACRCAAACRCCSPWRAISWSGRCRWAC